NQSNLLRPANIEMIPNHALKPHPSGLRTVKHTSVRNLELPESQVINISGSEVGCGKRGWQAIQPSPEKALHRSGPKPVTDLLQFCRLVTGAESIVQSVISDSRLF